MLKLYISNVERSNSDFLLLFAGHGPSPHYLWLGFLGQPGSKMARGPELGPSTRPIGQPDPVKWKKGSCMARPKVDGPPVWTSILTVSHHTHIHS